MKEQKEKRRYEKPKVMSMQQLAESLGACAAGSADCGDVCTAGSAPGGLGGGGTCGAGSAAGS
jgi:hypothetical protein